MTSISLTRVGRMFYHKYGRFKCYIIIATIVIIIIYFLSIFIRREVNHNDNDNKSTLLPNENPGDYLHSARFDLIFKMVYAYFYAHEQEVPLPIRSAYAEHLSVWNKFHEYCHIIKKSMYDAKKPCVEKHSLQDFINSYQNTIDDIRKQGFNSNLSQIPVDKNNFLQNGAHRLSAGVILNKEVAIQRLTFLLHLEWGFKFFEDAGLSNATSDTVMLEWLRIQRHLPNLNAKVRIMTVFTDNERERKVMRGKIQDNCSMDHRILFERKLNVTRQGALQLLLHMYGFIDEIEAKANELFSSYKSSSTFEVLFLFFFSRNTVDFIECKRTIATLYDDKVINISSHVSNTDEENLLLAQMILNKNSHMFMNKAVNPSACKDIAKEIASRSSSLIINPLPQIYLGRNDVLIHSSSVLKFFGLGQEERVSVLHRDKKFDNLVIGHKHGMDIRAYPFELDLAFKEFGKGALGLRNLGNVSNAWDVFHDNRYYGYCYGLKFLSLDQIKH